MGSLLSFPLENEREQASPGWGDGGGCQALPTLPLHSLQRFLSYTPQLVQSPVAVHGGQTCSGGQDLSQKTHTWTHREEKQWWSDGTHSPTLPDKAVMTTSSLVWDGAITLQIFAVHPQVRRMDFDISNVWWLGTSLANFRNKCPWSLTPSCKRQAAIVTVW